MFNESVKAAIEKRVKALLKRQRARIDQGQVNGIVDMYQDKLVDHLADLAIALVEGGSRPDLSARVDAYLDSTLPKQDQKKSSLKARLVAYLDRQATRNHQAGDPSDPELEFLCSALKQKVGQAASLTPVFGEVP